MRLAILLVALLCSTARADLVADAERLWEIAERETDHAKAVPLWEAAAVAFDKSVATAESKVAAAYGAMMAWQMAIRLAPVSKAMTPRDDAFLRALDVWEPFAGPDELPSITFTRAHMFYKHDQFAAAVPLFEDIVTRFTTHETAELSATMLLDALNQAGDFDQMIAWVARMRAMPKLTVGRKDLVETLRRLHVQIQRKQAERSEAAGQFASCAAIYRDLARDRRSELRDELWFNAGVCFERAGAIKDAIAAFRESAKRKTKLAAAAKARADRLKP